MRIGFLTLPGPWGGTQIHTRELARTLTERGHVVTIACLDAQGFHAYREHAVTGVALVHHVIPRSPATMSLREWQRSFAALAWDVCVLVKGDIDAGTVQLDLAARWRFRRYLTIEHLMAELGP